MLHIIFLDICKFTCGYHSNASPTKWLTEVAVLEGDFAAIWDLGLPISLSLQLHSCDLKQSEAKWAALDFLLASISLLVL